MSSLRNAVQRRNHRERAQPTERAKWGLLEKRKDYKLRAADHKLKQRKISALKQKASERNEDEFYFAMVNSATDGGVRRHARGTENSGGGGKALPMEVVKLMKTQDQGYLQTMLQRTRKERETCARDVVIAETGVPVQAGNGENRKIVYGDDDDDGEGVVVAERRNPGTHIDDNDMLDFDFDDRDDDVQQDLDLADADLSPAQKRMRERKQHALDVKRRKLLALQEQEEKLAAALQGLDDQRARMAGSLGGVTKKGLQFKIRERKR